jgi:hypothetical protein
MEWEKQKTPFPSIQMGYPLKTKKGSGWGLKNITFFNTTLLANTLWSTLTHDSIWHRIFLDKYLGDTRVFEWICKSSHIQQRASSLWNGLTKTFFLILHWLRWRPGSGSLIYFGRD